MILDPTNDAACLGQLTYIARELAPTTLIRTVARRLGSPESVREWLRSLPQTNDSGEELYRAIACDVPQRVRLLPDDPNCFERALAALLLLEVLDPGTQRMLVTIERPARHTGVVEWQGRHWVALDLFPHRNFSWGGLGRDVLRGVQGANQFVGKPVLTFYGLGGLSDLADAGLTQAVGKTEKKEQPSIRPIAPASGLPIPASGVGAIAAAAGAVVGAGGQGSQPAGKGAGNDASEAAKRALQSAAAGALGAAAGRNGGSLVGEEEETECDCWWGVE